MRRLLDAVLLNVALVVAYDVLACLARAWMHWRTETPVIDPSLVARLLREI